jgi:hypothetical protein
VEGSRHGFFSVLSQHLAGNPEKTTKTISQDKIVGTHSNLGPPEYGGVLITARTLPEHL